jgi:hypothetical protein
MELNLFSFDHVFVQFDFLPDPEAAQRLRQNSEPPTAIFSAVFVKSADGMKMEFAAVSGIPSPNSVHNCS